MKLIPGIILVLIIIAGGIFLLSKGGDAEVMQGYNNEKVEFDVAPPFSLTDFSGNTVSLSDYSGKIRVINSWTTWCPFCVDELPDFAKLQETFGDKIVVMAIDRAESLSKTKGFADELGVTEKIIMLLDPKDSFYTSIGGFSMPETLFIDGDGNIRVHKRGPMEFEEMKQKVESIINN